MRELKYAILGLLNQKSMSGYELSAEFGSALNEFWSAKHSQIYPELKKLTQEGMVTYEVAISGNVLQKKIYTITDDGRRDFLEWLSEDQPMSSTPKDIFRLRVFFSSELSARDRLKMFKDHLEQHRLRLTYLRRQMEKFDGIPDSDSSLLGDYMVLMGAIMREETTCKWLKKCIALSSRSEAECEKTDK